MAGIKKTANQVRSKLKGLSHFVFSPLQVIDNFVSLSRSLTTCFPYVNFGAKKVDLSRRHCCEFVRTIASSTFSWFLSNYVFACTVGTVYGLVIVNFNCLVRYKSLWKLEPRRKLIICLIKQFTRLTWIVLLAYVCCSSCLLSHLNELKVFWLLTIYLVFILDWTLYCFEL